MTFFRRIKRRNFHLMSFQNRQPNLFAILFHVRGEDYDQTRPGGSEFSPVANANLLTSYLNLPT